MNRSQDSREMIQEFIIRVPGDAVAQPRVRAFVKGNHASVYTPSSANNWKADIATYAQRAAVEAGWSRPDPKVPLCVDIDFHFRRPSGYRKGDRFKHTKPDRDNLDKCVLDALRGAGVIIDDAQVVDGRIRKLIDDSWQGAVIRISEPEGRDLLIGHKSAPIPQETLSFA